MTEDYIINLWKKVGWTSPKEYHNYLISGKEAPDDIIGSLLSPDKIDVKTFWKATDKWFFTDTVANCNNNLGISYSQKEANYHNHLIPLFLGLYGGVEFAIFNSKHKFGTAVIAEIGCGYGSFYEHYIKDHKDIHLYTGFDIIPRTQGVVEIEGNDGSFSEDQITSYKEKFNIFYSCNVFQHLTETQITNYLKQIYQMLPHGGFFVFSYTKKPEQGYTYHYGQKIEIMDIDYFQQKIVQMGYKIWFNYEQNKDSDPHGLIPIGIVIEKI